jgi:hypothetical protein
MEMGESLSDLALGTGEWHLVEQESPETVAESFIDSRRLSDVLALRPEQLPEPARTRHARMTARLRGT